MVDTARAARVRDATARMAPGRVSPGPERRGRRGRYRRRAGPYLLILPALLVVSALLLWPVARIAWMSLHEVGLRQLRGDPAEWVGVEHYRSILTSDFFWQVLRNTVLFAAVAVSLTLVVGTLVGLLLHRLGRLAAAIVASGAMLAWATPQITAAIIFRWLFGTTGGLVNYLLEAMPDWLVGSGWQDYSWFSRPLPTFVVLTLCVVWQSYPFVAVAVLAGLKSIPVELLEAARVDGGSPWRVFWTITFPLLRPIFMILLVFSIVWDFKVFTQLFVLAGGLANRDSFMLSLYAFSEAFAAPPNIGLGSAIAVVLVVIMLFCTVAYLRMMVRQGEVR